MVRLYAIIVGSTLLYNPGWYFTFYGPFTKMVFDDLAKYFKYDHYYLEALFTLAVTIFRKSLNLIYFKPTQ